MLKSTKTFTLFHYVNFISLCIFVLFAMLSRISVYSSNYYNYAALIVWYGTSFILLKKNIKLQRTLFKMIMVMLLFGFVCYLWSKLSNDNSVFQLFIQNYIYMFVIPMIYIVLQDIYSKKAMTYLIGLIFMLVFVSALFTIVGLQQHPLASRELATGKYNEFDLHYYEQIGIAGYGYIYAMTFVPIAIVCISGAKKHKLVWFVYCAVIFYTVFLANYTLAMILSVVGFGVALIVTSSMSKGINTTSFIVTFLILLIVFLALYLFRIQIFQAVLSFLSEKSQPIVYHRFKEIYDHFIVKSDSSELERFTLYERSLTAFSHYPLFGNAVYSKPEFRLGGHSEFFDALGRFGLFSLLYIGSYFQAKKCIVKTFFSKLRSRQFNLLFYIFILLAFLNPINTGKQIVIVVFLAIPLFFKINDTNTDVKNETRTINQL